MMEDEQQPYSHQQPRHKDWSADKLHPPRVSPPVGVRLGLISLGGPGVVVMVLSLVRMPGVPLCPILESNLI